MAPNNLDRQASVLKLFFDNPMNSIVLLSSMKLLILSIMAGVS